MKRYLAIGVATILLLSLSTAVVSCTAGKATVAGTYVCQHYPDDYLELHKDGTFYLKETEVFYDVAATGEWEVEGNELKLYVKSVESYGMEMPMHKVFTLEIKGNKLIDEEGEVWVKK